MLMRFLQAKVINSSVLSLLTTYRASEHFGGSASGGLCGDAYAGARDKHSNNSNTHTRELVCSAQPVLCVA